MKNKYLTYRDTCSKLAMLVAATATLTACGGGGGSPTPSIQPPITTPPPTEPNAPDPNVVASFKTTEFNRSWGLDAIGAADAYALGYTGENALIAVIDFNFDLSTNELDLHTGSRAANATYQAMYEAQIGEPPSTTPHGHAVAVTAAGLKNDSGIHGVAFDAQVIAVDYFSGVNIHQEFQNGITYHVSDPWTYAFNLGARIFNKSLGYDEGDVIPNPPMVSERYVIEYDTKVVELGGLLVSSAGNNSDPEPSLSNLDTLDRLAAAGLLDSGPGAFIIAGSVDENLQLSSFSDAAGTGESRFHYLVAPGGNVTFPWTGGGLATGGGTSFSAPHISGAAAVILSRWPSLTAREVRDIMFDTAQDLGAPGVDEVYGRGMLDLSAAMQPVGSAKLAVEAPEAKPVTEAAVHLGSAFGDAANLRSALSSLMILDKYERDFFIDANSLVTDGGGRLNLEARFDARRSWQSAALRVSEGTHLNYAISQDRFSTPAFALAGQAEEDFTPEIEAAFEFAGSYEGTDWYVGNGRSLSAAFARETFAASVTGSYSFTGGGDTVVPTGDGLYMAVNRSLSGNNELWFGVSHSKTLGYQAHPLEPLQEAGTITSAAMRFDHYRDKALYSAEFGVAQEKGSFLTGRSTGGLSFADGATTGWVTLKGDYVLSDKLSISGSATVAITEPDDTNASLFNNMGTLTATAFNVTATYAGALTKGDAFTLLVHQPLRVEHASVTLVSGETLNAETGAVSFRSDRVSLAPAGRELAVELGYRSHIAGWLIEANSAFRHDAGHFAGQNDVLVAFNLSKRF